MNTIAQDADMKNNNGGNANAGANGGNANAGAAGGAGVGGATGGGKGGLTMSLAEHAPLCKAKSPETCKYVKAEAAKLAQDPANKGKSHEELVKMAIGEHEAAKGDNPAVAKLTDEQMKTAVSNFIKVNPDIKSLIAEAVELAKQAPDEKKEEVNKVLETVLNEAKKQSGAGGEQGNGNANGGAQGGNGQEGDNGGDNGGDGGAQGGNGEQSQGSSYEDLARRFNSPKLAEELENEKKYIQSKIETYEKHAKENNVPYYKQQDDLRKMWAEHTERMIDINNRINEENAAAKTEKQDGEEGANGEGANADAGNENGGTDNGNGGENGGNANSDNGNGGSDNGGASSENGNGEGGTSENGNGTASENGNGEGATSENGNADGNGGGASTEGNADGGATTGGAENGNGEPTHTGTEANNGNGNGSSAEVPPEGNVGVKVDPKTGVKTIDISHLGFFRACVRSIVEGWHGNKIEWNPEAYKERIAKEKNMPKEEVKTPTEKAKGISLFESFSVQPENLNESQRKDLEQMQEDFANATTPRDRNRARSAFARALKEYGVNNGAQNKEEAKPDENLPKHMGAEGEGATSTENGAATGSEGGAATGSEGATSTEGGASKTEGENTNGAATEGATSTEGAATATAGASATEGEGQGATEGANGATAQNGASGENGGAGTGGSEEGKGDGNADKGDWKPEHQPKDDPVSEGTSPQDHAKVCKANPKSNCPFLKAHMSAEELAQLDNGGAQASTEGKGGATETNMNGGGTEGGGANANGGTEGGANGGATGTTEGNGGATATNTNGGTSTETNANGNANGNANHADEPAHITGSDLPNDNDNGGTGEGGATATSTEGANGEGANADGGNANGGTASTEGEGEKTTLKDGTPLHTGQAYEEPKQKSKDEELGQKITDILGELGVKADIADLKHGLRATKIELSTPPGGESKVKKSIATLVSQLHLPLNSIAFEGRGDKGNVTLTIPHGETGIVKYSDMGNNEAYQKARVPIVVGKDMDGNDIVDDLTDFDDLMISGEKGSGKSAAITSAVLGMCERLSPKELRMGFIDKKEADGKMLSEVPHNIFKNHPNLKCPKDAKDAIQMLDWYLAENDAKRAILNKGGCVNIKEYNKKFPNAKLPYDVIVLDEYSTLVSSASKADREAFNEKLRNIVSLCRAQGIYLIAATQGTRVKDGIEPNVKGQCRKMIFQQSAKMAKEASDDETEQTMAPSLTGKGDMMWKGKRGQGAFISGDEAKERIQKLNAKVGGSGAWYTPPPPKPKPAPAKPTQAAKPTQQAATTGGNGGTGAASPANKPAATSTATQGAASTATAKAQPTGGTQEIQNDTQKPDDDNQADTSSASGTSTTGNAQASSAKPTTRHNTTHPKFQGPKSQAARDAFAAKSKAAFGISNAKKALREKLNGKEPTQKQLASDPTYQSAVNAYAEASKNFNTVAFGVEEAKFTPTAEESAACIAAGKNEPAQPKQAATAQTTSGNANAAQATASAAPQAKKPKNGVQQGYYGVWFDASGRAIPNRKSPNFRGVKHEETQDADAKRKNALKKLNDMVRGLPDAKKKAVKKSDEYQKQYAKWKKLDHKYFQFAFGADEALPESAEGIVPTATPDAVAAALKDTSVSAELIKSDKGEAKKDDADKGKPKKLSALDMVHAALVKAGRIKE